MNKAVPTEFTRLFLLERLPEPLTPASRHLQLFDNYIENTRLRLRQIRDPYSKSWMRILQQRSTSEDAEKNGGSKLIEMNLNAAEYLVFERFKANEIRKNRYFYEFGQSLFVFDIFLGRLWGLNMAKIDFESRDDMERFAPTPFLVFEVTDDPFFSGENLVKINFADVQTEIAKAGFASSSRVNYFPD